MSEKRGAKSRDLILEMDVVKMADKEHLRGGIWMALEAHLARLDALVKELRREFEAKDAEAIAKTGRYLAECGVDLASDANSITVLDCLG